MTAVLAPRRDSTGLSLRERSRRLASGEFDTDRWRAGADRRARAADEAYRACVELRPMPPGAGFIRVGAKDIVDVAGFATRLGLRDHRRYPAVSAAVLRDVPAGAVVAKLVSAELGIGLGTPCRNPTFPHLSPSGSSTGSAVAVASGVCDLAVGTDSIASIRLPANACGVTGLRLTHDPALLPGLLPVSPLMDAPGWLARTPEDLAFAWNEWHLGPPVPEAGRPLRIGVPGGLLADGCLPPIVSALHRVAGRLAAVGHTVTTVDLGDLLPWRRAVYELVAHDAAEQHHDLAEELGDQVSASVRGMYDFGRSLPVDRIAEIHEGVARHRAVAAERFARDGVDAWLLPTTSVFPSPAGPVRIAAGSAIPDFDDPVVVAGLGYATIASFAGLPALTVPAAVEPTRRAPISVQLFGPPHSEPVLLDAARAVADAADRRDPR